MSRPDFGRLRWRLLVANLAVAASGVTAVIAGVWFTAPGAFASAMGMRGSGGMMGGQGQGLMDPLLRSAFGDAIGTSILIGLAAAILIAVAASLLLAARLSRPIDALAAASRRVADGDYTQRVPPADGELGELGSSFNDMAATLAATEERRRNLIGDVAHELRTPIASIRGYVEGLQEGVFAPGPDAWRVLDEQTARLGRLVDDLALLWQADSSDLRLEMEVLTGSELLAGAVERHRALAAAVRVNLALGHVAPITVHADRVRLAQAIDNLIGNALRYTPPGGTVTLDLAADHQWAVLSIRDTGSGLGREQAARVFERFYRGDPSRSRADGGSGLGLAITRSLVEAMGGSVAVSSPGPGQGATFILRLPVG